MLTISDCFSLFVNFLMLMILCILMENDRAVQQRQPVGNNEQREQVRKSQANTGNEDENQNHYVPPNTNYPPKNDEGLG